MREHVLVSSASELFFGMAAMFFSAQRRSDIALCLSHRRRGGPRLEQLQPEREQGLESSLGMGHNQQEEISCGLRSRHIEQLIRGGLGCLGLVLLLYGASCSMHHPCVSGVCDVQCACVVLFITCARSTAGVERPSLHLRDSDSPIEV